MDQSYDSQSVLLDTDNHNGVIGNLCINPRRKIEKGGVIFVFFTLTLLQTEVGTGERREIVTESRYTGISQKKHTLGQHRKEFSKIRRYAIHYPCST